MSNGCNGTLSCPGCPSNQTCGATNRCETSSCSNGIKDPGEGDVDCGGTCPTKCGLYDSCGALSDCDSHTTCEQTVCLPGRWTALSPLPAARGNTAGAVVGNTLYVFGGLDANGAPSNTTFIFNGTQWSQGPSFPGPRQQASATVLSNGSIALVGGAAAADAGVARRVDVYTPASNSWSRLPDLPRDRSGACSVGLPDGRLVVIGGYENHDDAFSLRSVAILAPDAGAWTETPDVLSVARSMPLCQLQLDGGIFLAGGVTTGTAYCTSSAEVLDPTGWVSRPLPSMPDAQAAGGGGVLADGRAWMLGGWGCSSTDRGGNPAASSWVFFPSVNQWASATSIPIATSGPTQVNAPGGGFWVVGGLEEGHFISVVPDAVTRAWKFSP